MAILSFVVSVTLGSLCATWTALLIEFARAWANKERRRAIRSRSFHENLNILLS